MVHEEVCALLDQSADFLRGGDVTAAMQRVSRALAVVEWLAPHDQDLKDEVLLARQRCESALSKEMTMVAHRERERLFREVAAAENHNVKSL